MGVKSSPWGGVRKRAVSIALYIVFSVMFIVSSVLATATYSAVVKTQSDVKLTGADMGAEVLANGSLKLTFSISVTNPSNYVLQIQSVSWFVYLVNGTTGPDHLTSLTSDYIGPTLDFTVSKRSDKQFTFQGIVSNRAMISRLNGFVNYSRSQGQDYTIGTVPYLHEFGLVATIGDYKHDYLREIYLNDLVTVSLAYSSEATS